MTHIFTLKTNVARCAHCGTVSRDGKCDCTKTDCPWNPAWEPYDDEACDEVVKLRAENNALREAITSIRDEASTLLSCHIETPNLARDALRRMRVFIDEQVSAINKEATQCE